MKKYTRIILFLLLPATTWAQRIMVDSLKQVFTRSADDSIRYSASRSLYNYYEELNRDSALFYADKAMILAHNNNKPLNEAFCLNIKGYQLLHLGRYAASFQCLMQAFKIAEDPVNDKQEDETWTISTYPSPGKSRLLILSMSEHMFAILMEQTQNTEQQILHFKEARAIATEIDNKNRRLLSNMNLGGSYVFVNKPDSAMDFIREAEKISIESGLNKYRGSIYCITGDIYLLKGDTINARKYFYEGLQWAKDQNSNSSTIMSNARLLKYYMTTGEKDSILYYALNNLEVIRSMGAIASFKNNIGTAYEGVAIAYQILNEFDSAFKYLGLALVTKDSLYKIRIQNLAEFQNMSFTQQKRYQELQAAEKQRKAKAGQWRVIASLGALILIFLLIMFFQWRSSKQKKKANLLLQQQKEKIESTLAELKATQSQLIQSEKMASLGELTAGIAHEIQNPLNFVNNFSEINTELIDELKQELDSGNTKEIINLANSIRENNEKITHHGKRADSIVKGMLQHSRNSSGQKELSDINTIVDECMRLSYHGLRAKDKTFNAKMQTNFDPNIPPVTIAPQDIGRVILNLFTNAFYSVTQKKKQFGDSFEPVVIASTSRSEKGVFITIQDNGNGIPQRVIDKIFQPFFTTKPVGEGTGLGLSMSYEIITKGHGGELKVETKEGEYAKFIIFLPTKS